MSISKLLYMKESLCLVCSKNVIFYVFIDFSCLSHSTSPLLTTPASTSWVTCVLFVPTTMNWENMCTVCAHYYEFTTVYYVCDSLLQIAGTCVLFVATTTNWEHMCTVCHYYECTTVCSVCDHYYYMCTVCHYYEFTTVYSVCGHYYELQVHVNCLWPLLQIVSTHVLFVATNTKWTCTVCGHYYELQEHMYCLWPLRMNSLQCTPPLVFRVYTMISVH